MNDVIVVKIKLFIPQVKFGEEYFGCVNGQEYDVIDNGSCEYVTVKALNGGSPTYLLKEWCTIVENFDLPEELFKI